MDRRSRLLHQCRKPAGWFGRLLLWNFNHHHSRLTDWGLKHVSIGKEDTILDIGCGGGRTVHKLAGAATGGRVHGIDYSEESVAASRRTNRHWIEMGRVEIQLGSVSRLPFPDHTFDLVTAVETHYYWPDLASDVREVQRVLKPGGKLLIIAEAYRGGKYEKMMKRAAELTDFSPLSVEEHRKLFTKAGFSDVQVFEEYDKGWICAVGARPA